ncbi:MFS transporter [Phenylobacterium sp. Root77]|jgi:MFS family permease|uniref:MFS transporter n=1 Tax=unclassified Phenylobacterium TaxID=2640670 RepID=UPI0006FD5628|nr:MULTISPECIES: MFS transporter [unclassified Phenylobacterium]KQW71684.1 MFS transporter [Phenylobacterium sp. Root1277]KQW94604.1 MFS transporter [Phenylobacterium sp. Root1290]KRC44297.1 MFS transporter [Phenylobacterium sp. Root77]
MAESFTTNVPARLDRLPWSRFHWLVVAALGITWILDGLEVTLVGSLSPAISEGLGLTTTQIGLSGSAYILGAVLGALVFGRLTDTFGRRRLFTITVAVYLLATIATGFAWDFWSFLLFRFLTGAGIGGEYGAVNSAIQELIPARRRGYTDLAINGSFWLGAALGAMGSLIVLDPALVDQEWGWRLAFIIGGLLALIVIYIRRYIPESPRWLMTHGHPEQALAVVETIEAAVERDTGRPLGPTDELPTLRLRPMRTSWLDIARSLIVRHPKRTVLGLVLMATQAFCYNAIFFTYALILTKFYEVPAASIGWFILPFAAGNFLGPLLLGHFFDSVGRKPMIALTYGVAGALLCITGWMFAQGMLTATTQTAAWTVIFFFASAGASAAYLTVGESFPLETRAVTISLFYAFGTLLGGVGGPALFGALIDSGARDQIMWGYMLGGGLMLSAAVVELFLGVAAERKPLEEVSPPLSIIDDAP